MVTMVLIVIANLDGLLKMTLMATMVVSVRVILEGLA